jgi:hypothetical protein
MNPHQPRSLLDSGDSVLYQVAVEPNRHSVMDRPYLAIAGLGQKAAYSEVGHTHPACLVLVPHRNSGYEAEQGEA